MGMTDRIHKFEGIVNFRDFGGYPTRDGRSVTFGKLYRSADYSEITPADVAQLEALGVKFVVDLRRTHERTMFASRWPAEGGARVIWHDIPGAEPEISSVKDYTAENVRNAMRMAYARYPYEARFIALFGDLFRGLAEEGGPAIVHCAAGKDRTGLACALVLHALGVDRETIMADYELSNDTIDFGARVERIRARIQPQYGGVLTDEAITPMIRVERSYLEAGLTRIEEAEGSLDAYIEDRLAISPRMLDQLRAHLLV